MKNSPIPSPDMILVLQPGLAVTKRNRIRQCILERGCKARVVNEGGATTLEITGDVLPLQTLSIDSWDGVAKVLSLTSPYPHVAWGAGRQHGEAGATVDPTEVRITAKLSSLNEGGGSPSEAAAADQLTDTKIGAGSFEFIAGPCAVEQPERTLELAKEVKASGAGLFRAGAYKPRTSPYAFQGLEARGLEILANVKKQTGLAIVTEVLDISNLEAVQEVADVLQVGSRNMHNYSLLKELGKTRKPVLLKRGYAATVKEFLLAAEYLLCGGNDQVILCERGIRSAAGSDSVILDLGAVPELRKETHLPVIVDPSHGARSLHRVIPLARAAAAVGADGIIVEIHDDPAFALSDGQQALSPTQFSQMVQEVTAVRQALRF